MALITSRDVTPAEVDWHMKVFKAGETLEGTEDWVEADEDDNGVQDDVNFKEAEGTIGVMVTYNFNLGSFGWSNLDRWYSLQVQKRNFILMFLKDLTEIIVQYSYTMIMKTQQLQEWIVDETEELFTEHYGLIPVGLEVHIIMVAEIDGVLHYAIQGTTIVDDHIEVISSLTPITQPALESLINGLP